MDGKQCGVCCLFWKMKMPNSKTESSTYCLLCCVVLCSTLLCMMQDYDNKIMVLGCKIC